jgi:hypothetical protein
MRLSQKNANDANYANNKRMKVKENIECMFLISSEVALRLRQRMLHLR